MGAFVTKKGDFQTKRLGYFQHFTTSFSRGAAFSNKGILHYSNNVIPLIKSTLMVIIIIT